MISKRTNPVIGRLSELLVSGNRAPGFLDVGTIPSPRSPLEYRNIPSPRGRDGTKIEFQGGRKNCDLGGVGLGIVAALERSNTCNPDESNGHKSVAKYALFSSNNLNRSDPFPIRVDLDMDSLEDYTYVTSHGPDNKSFTKVYYDPGRKGYNRTSFDGRIDSAISGIEESPAATSFVVKEAAYPTSDFLSCCHLCKKKLQGKDIYMYRGEKAFCSVECRSRQILIDERKEQCRSEVKRSADVSGSPYANSPIFSAGVLAI